MVSFRKRSRQQRENHDQRQKQRENTLRQFGFHNAISFFVFLKTSMRYFQSYRL